MPLVLSTGKAVSTFTSVGKGPGIQGYTVAFYWEHKGGTSGLWVQMWTLAGAWCAENDFQNSTSDSRCLSLCSLSSKVFSPLSSSFGNIKQKKTWKTGTTSTSSQLDSLSFCILSRFLSFSHSDSHSCHTSTTTHEEIPECVNYSVCVCACSSVSTYICIRVCMCVCLCICVSVYIPVCMPAGVCVCICVCMCPSVCLRMCACVWVSAFGVFP